MSGNRRIIQVGMAVISTVVTTLNSKIMAMLGDAIGATESENAEWWQHVGYASRPSKSSKDSRTAAQAVVVQGGDRDVCIGSQDLRGLELYALLKEGETCVYAAGIEGISQARSLWKTDGSITHFTKEANIDKGDSVYARVATGMDSRGIPDGFTWSGPWGTSKFDHTGYHVVHTSGACFDMGGIGLPAPLDVIGSYVKIKAGTVNIQSSGMSHGDGVSPVDPLAKSTFVNAMLLSLQTQIALLGVAVLTLQAHNAAIGTLPIVIGPLALALPTFAPATVASTAASVAAIAGVAALPGAVLLIPSTLSSS